MKTWLQFILLLCDDKQHVITNSYPYLRIDSIASRAVKGLDMQVLPNSLEEDLKQPSFSIKSSNRHCVNREVICKEAAGIHTSKIFTYNKSHIIRALMESIKSGKLYRLIGDKSRLSINLSRLSDHVR